MILAQEVILKAGGATELLGRARPTIEEAPAMIGELLNAFREAYGAEPRVFQAPGRVNLIGEHTDYNEGFVLPVALDLVTSIAAAPRTDGRLVVRSANFEGEVSVDLSASPAARDHWSDYCVGVAVTAAKLGYSLGGASLLVDGRVPLGAGLSSSAALEVATATALFSLYNVDVEPQKIALLCRQAENDFVGMRCGIMDQFISACGREGHALLLDCRNLEYSLIPLPSEVKVVICNSMVRHELTGGEYNERRRDCERGCAQLGVESLREASVDSLAKLDTPLLKKRCLHVVSEIERTRVAAEALQAGDVERFGALMYESHASLRDDYEVSCPGAHLLVELARPVPGVYGSSNDGRWVWRVYGEPGPRRRRGSLSRRHRQGIPSSRGFHLPGRRRSARGGVLLSRQMHLMKNLLFWILALLVGTALAQEGPSYVNIKKIDFGQTADGKPVEQYVLTNKNGLSAKLMTYGATWTNMTVPDREGKMGDVLLGFDDLEWISRRASLFRFHRRPRCQPDRSGQI